MPAGRCSWRTFAAYAISAKLTAADGPCTAPPSTRVRATSVCKRCAPIFWIFSTSIRQDFATAPPANTIERDPKVPKPNGEVAVSP